MNVNVWNERYNTKDYAYGVDANDFLAEMANHIPQGRVLCLAEGQCRNAVFLAKQGYQVIAVDWSQIGLERGRQLAHKNKVEIDTICCDLSKFKIKPKSYSGIVSIFGHLPQQVRAQLYQDAIGGLVSGGVFILEAYTPEQLTLKTGGPKDIKLLASMDTLCAELEGLEFKIARKLKKERYEGKLHCGYGFIVQIMGFKK